MVQTRLRYQLIKSKLEGQKIRPYQRKLQRPKRETKRLLIRKRQKIRKITMIKMMRRRKMRMISN